MFWINIGRVVMLMIWCVLLCNILQPFPRPTRYFLDIALLFMLVMHSFQLLLLKNILSKKPKIRFHSRQQWRLFLFGAVELCALQKKIAKTKTVSER